MYGITYSSQNLVRSEVLLCPGVQKRNVQTEELARGNPGEHLTTCSCLPTPSSLRVTVPGEPEDPAPSSWGSPLGPLQLQAPHIGRNANTSDRRHARTGSCARAPWSSSGSGHLCFGGHEDLAHIWGAHSQPRSALTCEKWPHSQQIEHQKNWNFYGDVQMTNLLGKHCLLRWWPLGAIWGKAMYQGRFLFLPPSLSLLLSPFLKTSSICLTLQRNKIKESY